VGKKDLTFSNGPRQRYCPREILPTVKVEDAPESTRPSSSSGGIEADRREPRVAPSKEEKKKDDRRYEDDGYEEEEDDGEVEEEDEEDDDDGDGEYVFRSGRSNAHSLYSSGQRTLRSHSSNRTRYNPHPCYGSSSNDPQQQPYLQAGYTRRTTEDNPLAPGPPTADYSNSNKMASPPEPPQPLPRRRARPSNALPVPIPVPNLIKKSRGRRVPTIASLDRKRGGSSSSFHDGDLKRAGSGKVLRTYTCRVQGCGKCFARGEHLKRHVRSIHTYEKRMVFFLFFSLFSY
jgi:hypothetical protein